MRVRRRKTASQVLLALRSKRQRQNYYVITRSTTTELSRDTHKFVQERNIFPVFGSKESEVLHVKHPAVVNRIYYKSQPVSNRNLIKLVAQDISRSTCLINCMTTEHNNFLTVISKEGALQYQTAANFPIPTSCNNQQLLRLSYLVRMIEVGRMAKSIR